MPGKRQSNGGDDMSNRDGIITVSGATGRQGGAVARHLLADGWHVRALTRDPGSPAAQALAASGAEVVEGEFDDRASLDRALRGAHGVFSVQNFWLPGVGFDGEVRQGRALADAAAGAGVGHFVYSSVGGADRNSGLAHFESKWLIEQHVRKSGLPYTIFRPVYFMENLRAPWNAPKDGVLALGYKPEVPVQMIAVEDIGAFAALAFARPEQYLGTATEIAGDSLTMPQVAERWSRVTGEPVRYVQVPLDQIRSRNPENARMVEWMNESGYRADIPALRRLYPGLHTFEAWLRG
jgi:uncharacterized protein YbjT (DUF2867 family)